MGEPGEAVVPLGEVVAEIKEAGGAAFRLCYQCGKCDVVCPWNRVTAFSMRKIIRQAAFGLPEIELQDIWRCTSCGTCPAHCPRGVDQIGIGVSIRRVASSYGVLPGSVRAVGVARGSLATEGNPVGGERRDRAAWAAGLSVKPFEEGMEVLYFVGCYYSYDPRLKKVAVATAKILQAAGVDFGILGSKESCCGESIRKTGSEELFKSLARDNIKAFIDHGVKRILVSSPHCYHTLKNEYPELMVAFEVVHVTQFLWDLIERGRLSLRGSFERRVAYHDPCYLGRHNGIYEAPRDILRKVRGLELVEMQDSGAASLCCGGGGGRIWMDTPKAERFADLRIAQAIDAGADVLVTSCPYCIANFEEARLSLGEEECLEVKDVTEVVQEALETEGRP